MIALQSMELDDEDKLDAPMPIAMPDKPDYPFGLVISLTDAELAKLDLDPADATVGGMFMFTAMARITSVSSNESEGRSCCRVEAQIEQMGIADTDGAD